MKKKISALIILLLAIGLLTTPILTHADFGGYSGDSDYGGSYDYGGSSDWGSSSWDSSDDWGSSSGSYLNINGGGPYSLSEYATTAIVFIIFFLVFRGNKKSKVAPTGANAKPSSALSPIAKYLDKDPCFGEAELCEKMSNLYVQMQNCWTNKDIEPVRPYLTDAFYSQMDRQLAAMKNAGRTNYVERITVLGVEIRGWYQANNMDNIILRLRTRIVDYTKDDSTGNIVSGSEIKELFMEYEWHMVRTSGLTTASKAIMTDVHCPSCAAPLSINQSAKCPYCRSVITLKEHDWAISSIKGISQRSS